MQRVCGESQNKPRPGRQFLKKEQSCDVLSLPLSNKLLVKARERCCVGKELRSEYQSKQRTNRNRGSVAWA